MSNYSRWDDYTPSIKMTPSSLQPTQQQQQKQASIQPPIQSSPVQPPIQSSPVQPPIQPSPVQQKQKQAPLQQLVKKSEFPALMTTPFTMAIDNIDTIPIKKQTYSVSIHNNLDSTLNVLHMREYHMTVSTTGYVIILNDKDNQGWKNTNIKINTWISMAGSMNGKYITIATDNGSYSTDNFGQTWRSITRFVSVGMDVTGQFQAAIGDAFYLSNDYGVTWTSQDAPNDSFTLICVSNDASRVVISGLFYSYLFTNGTFKTLSIPSGTVNNVSIQSIGGTYVYTIDINGKGLYRSYDGEMWVLIKSVK